jgi:hypothetical protein
MEVDDAGKGADLSDDIVSEEPLEVSKSGDPPSAQTADSMDVDDDSTPKASEAEVESTTASSTPRAAVLLASLPIAAEPVNVPTAHSHMQASAASPSSLDAGRTSPEPPGNAAAETVISVAPSLSQSSLVSPAEMRHLGLVFHSVYRTVHCVHPNCQTAMRAENVIGHLSRYHHITVPKEEKEALTKCMESLHATSEHPDVIPGVEPIEGLRYTIDGHCCNECNYCVPAYRSFTKHWNQDHPDHDMVTGDDRFHKGAVQSFYTYHPRYFEVHPIAPAPLQDPFSTFLRYNAARIKKTMTETLPLPVDGSEVQPLLQITNWDIHLKPWLTDRTKLQDLLKLRSLPYTTDTSYLGHLRSIVHKYMAAVCDVATGTPVIVRQMLKTFPR